MTLEYLEKKLIRLKDELRALEVLQLEEQFKNNDTRVIDDEIEVTKIEISFVFSQVRELLGKEKSTAD